MDFNEIKKELSGVNFQALRVDKESYFEAVFVKDELVKLVSLLQKIFGEPAEHSEKIQEMLKDIGGVWPGQTLYIINVGTGIVFAMLWPWQDGERITLKMGVNIGKGG